MGVRLGDANAGRRPRPRGAGQSPGALVGARGQEGGRPPRLPSEFSPLARALQALSELHRRHAST